jgi:ribose transport system substrate-binding protein
MANDEFDDAEPVEEATASQALSRRRFTQLAALGGLGVIGAGALGADATGALAAPFAGGPSGKVNPRTQKYYLVTGNVGDPFYIDVRAGYAAADKAYGFAGTKVVGTSNVDVAQIVNLAMELIAKPDTSGLMIPNLSQNAYGSVYKAASAKQLPILNYLNDFTGPRISFIGASESAEAVIGAQTIGKALGGKGKVSYIAQLNQADLVNKGKVFAQTLAKNFPGIKYLGAETYDGSPGGGLNTFNAVHSKNPDLAGVYWGDGSGGAVAQSIHSAASSVKLLLTDIVSASLTAVQKGYAFACFGPSQFDVAFYAPQLLYWWNCGYRVPDPVLIPPVVVDKTNVAAFSAAPYKHGKITGEPNPSIA